MNRSVKVAWPRISRWILLVLVGPLFGVAVWHFTRFDASEVTGMAFSSDGRELMVFRGVKDSKSRQLDDASCKIQVWEVATKRLLRSQITGHGKVEATRDGEHLVDFSLQGRVRVLSPESFQPQFEWQLPPACGKIDHVTSTDRLLLVNSIAEKKTDQVTCLDLHDGSVVKQWSGSQVFDFLTRDGRRLFVSIFDSVPKTWTTHAYSVEGAAITPLHVTPFEGRTIRGDSAGNVIFVVVPGTKSQFKIHDLRTGTDYEWKPLARFGQFWDLFITDDGSLRVINQRGGTLAAYDVAAGALIGEQQFTSSPTYILDFAVSPDGRFIAGTAEHRQVNIWELATGRIVARLPDHRGMRYGLAIVFGIWCLAWVVGGTRLNRPRPWLDVILINGLLLSTMIAYAVPRPLRAMDLMAFVYPFSVLIALAGLLTVWWIHGGMRWSLRLAGLIGGLGVAVMVLLISPLRAGEGIWNIMLGAVSFVAGLSLLLTVWRWRGLAISRDTLATTNSPPRNYRWQIPLSDSLILTAAIALSFGVMRFVVPGARPMFALAQFSILGTTLAVVVFVATWAALSTRSRVVRWGLSGLVVPVVGVLGVWFTFGQQFEVMWWWCELVCVLTAITVLLSLRVFRLHGYRLNRVS